MSYVTLSWNTSRVPCSIRTLPSTSWRKAHCAADYRKVPNSRKQPLSNCLNTWVDNDSRILVVVFSISVGWLYVQCIDHSKSVGCNDSRLHHWKKHFTLALPSLALFLLFLSLCQFRPAKDAVGPMRWCDVTIMMMTCFFLWMFLHYVCSCTWKVLWVLFDWCNCQLKARGNSKLGNRLRWSR